MWQQALAHAKTYEAPDPICGTVIHTDQYWGNWAGHVAKQSQFSGNPAFTWSQSEWTQPAVAGNGNFSDSQWGVAPAASFWTGIGEYVGPQAGVDSISTADPEYRFWTEDPPADPIYEGPTIRPGDIAYVFLHYHSDQTAYYFLENETTQTYQPFTNSAPYDGYRWATFINERLEGTPNHDYLPGFAATPVVGNSFGTDTQTWNLTTNNDKIVMTDDCTSTGTKLSEPNGVDDNTSDFTQYFYNSQPWSDTCTPMGG
jgi:hypothetical protein